MHLLLERARIILFILLVILFAALAGCSAPAPVEEPPPEQPSGRILILPHHDVAAPMVREALSGFEEDKVVILSPHHEAVGPPFITAQKGYDEALTARLTDAGAQARDDLVKAEWGVTELVPYFDGCALAAGALSRTVSDRAAGELASEAAELVRDGCLVVISLDFSHGLTADMAQVRDEETKALVLAGEPAAVLGLSSEYVDSSVLLYVAMEAGRQLEYEPTELAHKNAADFRQVDGEVTSYFIFEWAAD
ncbi:MAG TPA: hypothetical protein VN369_08930 [Terriglobales bacterium]|nr:hypothetical protein [Terriglobales bacterium]